MLSHHLFPRCLIFHLLLSLSTLYQPFTSFRTQSKNIHHIACFSYILFSNLLYLVFPSDLWNIFISTVCCFLCVIAISGITFDAQDFYWSYYVFPDTNFNFLSEVFVVPAITIHAASDFFFICTTCSIILPFIQSLQLIGDCNCFVSSSAIFILYLQQAL